MASSQSVPRTRPLLSRRTAAASVFAVGVATTSLFAGGVAQAAGNPYTARGVCGSSYTVSVATHDLGGKARIHLLYSPSTGYNCVVTMKTLYVGIPTTTEAWLLVQGRSWQYDKGYFRYYAGPIRRPALHTCVAYAGGAYGVNWTSGWVGCR